MSGTMIGGFSPQATAVQAQTPQDASQLASVQRERDALKIQSLSLGNQVEELQSRLAAMQRERDEVRTSAKETRKQLSAVNHELAQVKAASTSQDEKIATLQSQVADLDTHKRVAAKLSRVIASIGRTANGFEELPDANQ